MTVGSYAKKPKLSVEFQWDGKTRLKNVYYTPPFKITSPFETSSGRTKIIQMSSSAGIMAGDCYEMNLKIGQKSRVEWTTQSYEKIHKMNENAHAQRTCSIRIERDSELVYFPQATIPFANSDFDGRTSVSLEDETSRLVYTDILGCGRAAMGESFAWRNYRNVLHVYRGKRLIYRENLHLLPTVQKLDGIGFFEGQTHTGSMLLCGYSFDTDRLNGMIREVNEKREVVCGMSRLWQGDYVIKCLGDRAQVIEDFFRDIIEIL